MQPDALEQILFLSFCIILNYNFLYRLLFKLKTKKVVQTIFLKLIQKDKSPHIMTNREHKRYFVNLD